MRNRFGKTIPWRTLVSAAAATAFFATVGATSAFAAVSADGYVTGASPRPPAPGLEMLGISDVECDPSGISAAMGQQTWASPKFYLMGSADYNSNPNPYFVNAVENYNDAQSGGAGNAAQPTAVIGGNKTVRTETKAGGNPDAGLAVYGFSDDVTALWEMKPDVIMGTAAGTCDYSSATYRDPMLQANAEKFQDYAPKSVTYSYSDISSIIGSMYKLAAAADEVVAESNGAKKLRYNEDAMTVAKNYEKYIHGLQGYLLSRLDADKAEKKTVAIVMAVDADGNYTLMNDTSGNATALRYLEVVRNVSTNLADTLGTTTVTADQLATADMIVLNTTMNDSNAVLNNFTADMVGKTYYTLNGNQNIGCLYSVARNSVDNAQDMGRILGCLYPNYIDQDELVSYYYDEFYHIRSDKLGEVLALAMTGVANWDATDTDRTVWTAADAEGYKKADVQYKLDQGIAYIQQMNADDVPEALKLNVDEQGKGYIENIEYKDPNAPDIAPPAPAAPKAQTISGKSSKTVTYKAAKKGKYAKKLSATKTVKSLKSTYGLKAKTSMTYKLSSVTKAAKKFVTVTKSGKVTVKKGLKRGTYTVKVKVSAAKSSAYKAATKTITLKVRVK